MFSYHGHSSDRMFLLLEIVYLTESGVHWSIWSMSFGSCLVSASVALGYRCHHIWLFHGSRESQLRSSHSNNKAISPAGPLPPFYHAHKHFYWSPDVRGDALVTPPPTWHDLDQHRGRFWHTRQHSSQGRAARNVSSSGRVWRWGPEGQRPMVQTGLPNPMWPTGSKPSWHLPSISISKGVTRQALLRPARWKFM